MIYINIDIAKLHHGAYSTRHYVNSLDPKNLNYMSSVKLRCRGTDVKFTPSVAEYPPPLTCIVCFYFIFMFYFFFSFMYLLLCLVQVSSGSMSGPVRNGDPSHSLNPSMDSGPIKRYIIIRHNIIIRPYT